MKMNRKLLTMLAALFILGAAAGCTKKNDAALAEMNAKLEAMQAELDKARSGNAAPEEIEKLEIAVAEIAEQEKTLETTASAAITAAPAIVTQTSTTAASTATATQTATTPAASSDFRINGTVLFEYTGSSRNVIIPNNVTSIREAAFFNKINITSVTIPDSVTSIEDMAFRYTGLTSVIIPNSVTSIGSGAFSDTKLTSVTIGNSVTSIGDFVFSGCANLTAINVDSGNAKYSSADGVLYNKNKTVLIQVPAGKTGTFIIPNSVTSIRDAAFSGCTNLTSVTIPNSVTNIGEQTFARLKNITSITIGNGVKSIGKEAFQETGITSINIPNSVTTIEIGAFQACEKLTSVTIGNNVAKIGWLAFNACTSLTSITIPASVTDMMGNAFGHSGAFSACPNLTSVTFQGSFINFGTTPFDGNLHERYLETGPGTFTRTRGSMEWQRQAQGA